MKSGKLTATQRRELQKEHGRLNPLDLAEAIERGLGEIFGEEEIEGMPPAGSDPTHPLRQVS